MIEIVKISNENHTDLHKANQPFTIIWRLEITFANGHFACREQLSETPTRKQYPDYDGATAKEYIDSDNRAAYLAYCAGKCVGQILLAKTWNGYAHIEDISVAENYRSNGVGSALLNQAYQWAEEQQLSVFSIECQDNNIAASRFFLKNGFTIGGVNTELYKQLGKPYADETAVFWYKAMDGAENV